MANPIIQKTAIKTVVPGQDMGVQPTQKTGASKFDQVREKLQTQQASQTEMDPDPIVTRVSAEQKRVLEADLRRKLQGTRPSDPKQIFRPEFENARVSLQDLNQRVSALPKTPAFEPVRNRLASVEAHFKSTDKLLSNLGNLDNPRELMKIQIQMYQLTQNMEILSKFVDFSSQTVKQLLQVNV